MSFPSGFLEELRSRLPLSDIVGKRLRLTRAGREFKACCPFHNEKSPSFYINDDKQFFHCFGCGAHGDVIGFTMRHDRLSFPEAVESLASAAGLPVPQDSPVDRQQFDHEKRLYQLLERATLWFTEQLFAPHGREALNYLLNRGLSEDGIRRFQLGYAPNDGQALLRKLVGEGYKVDELMNVGLAKKSDERNDHYSFFRNRVIFPVGDRRGRTVAFGGRVLGDGEPKYLNSPDHSLFHKGKLLYGLSRARTALSAHQPIIVVEGYMDVIALAEAGFTGAVAPLGTALTEDQMFALWKLLPAPDVRDPTKDLNPILCFDGDNAGLRAALRAVERALPLLTPSQTFRIAFMPEGKDPDDLIKASGKSAMDDVIAHARPMIDVIWDMTLAARRMDTPEERSTFLTAIKQRVSRIGHENLRQLYQDEIQRRLSALLRPQHAAPGAYNQSYNGSTYNKGRSRTGKFDGPKGWQSNQSEPAFLNRRAPPSARYLREKALLAIIINHSSLFADFGEELAQTTFGTPNFEALRQRVVDVLSLDSHETLDAAELSRHLCQSPGNDLSTNQAALDLKDVLSEATYMHASFARPDQSTEIARKGWKSLWNKQLLEHLHAELQTAKRHFADKASEENYSRLMALRQEVELMGQEAGNSTTAENGFLDASSSLRGQD